MNMERNRAKADELAKEEAALKAEQEEQDALQRIINSFKSYRRSAELDVCRWQQNFAKLPKHHQEWLASQHHKYARALQCIYSNNFFILSMLAAFDPESASVPPPPHLAAPCGASHSSIDGQGLRPAVCPSPTDVEKVRYVLKNLSRDWSEDGALERSQSYGRILAELQRLYAGRLEGPKPDVPRVLVPGAGLGRLCCEIAGLGYEAQGNEFSYFMLIASSFMLNYTSEKNQYTVFPWVTSTCNNFDDEDQLRGVSLPETLPADIVSRAPPQAAAAVGGGLLSMAAGDFEEVYSAPDQAGAWDCVATCFFMDTAHNVLRYLEVIHYALKPGGAWINLGPLLYHWADGHGEAEDDLSIELPLTEIRRIALAMGFRLEKEERVDTGYTCNPRSMYKTVYQSSFWTMIKQ
mmetsp:Transcript_27342/g.73946  ORF Transcript_27342/g.73946 Transcript_27342/m.73946 type:complete len:407 (+) Transcript_27342:25-1245(+)